MKVFLPAFALVLLLSLPVYSQTLVAFANYEGPDRSFRNAVLVPAGNDKLAAYRNNNQLLCYDANLKVIWKSEALRKGQQFTGELTVNQDTIKAFVLKLEPGSKQEIIALQRYSLASGQLLEEQKVYWGGPV